MLPGWAKPGRAQRARNGRGARLWRPRAGGASSALREGLWVPPVSAVLADTQHRSCSASLPKIISTLVF